MEAKEKAKEIYNKMIVDFIDWTYHVPTDLNANHTIFSEAKQRALIVVDYVIDNIKPIEINQLITSFKSAKDFNDNLVFTDNYITKNLINEKLYWKKVKQEIEKL